MENNFQLPQALENKYIESASYARSIKSAYHRLRPKIFNERFKNLALIALIGMFFFPIISIVTSESYMYLHIVEVVSNVYLAAIISVLLLGVLELTKNHMLSNALQTFFSNSGKSLVTFIFAFLFSGLSIFLSYSGAEMLVKNLDTSKQSIKDTSFAQLATMESKYNSLIAEEQSKIENINKMAEKQWKRLLTTPQISLLSSYEDNKKDLRLLMEKERDLIRSDKTENLAKAETSVNQNSFIFKGFAVIIELMLVLSISFYEFYAFKTVREDIDLNDYKSDPSKYQILEPKNIKSIATNTQIQAPSIGLNSGNNERKVIGFLKPDKIDLPSTLNGESVINQSKRICINCGEQFEYKHWAKKYCTEKCRIDYWEKSTGKKLKLKKAK